MSVTSLLSAKNDDEGGDEDDSGFPNCCLFLYPPPQRRQNIAQGSDAEDNVWAVINDNDDDDDDGDSDIDEFNWKTAQKASHVSVLQIEIGDVFFVVISGVGLMT